MKYLLDANVLIMAKRSGFHFEICPGFWKWLIKRSATGLVCSISNVEGEIREQEDELSAWAQGEGSGIFKSSADELTYLKMVDVSNWVMGQPYKESSRSQFFKKADPFIISYALAHQLTVVTLEKRNNDPNQVKIPNVCDAFGVPWMSPWDMLRRELVSFVLEDEMAMFD